LQLAELAVSVTQAAAAELAELAELAESDVFQSATQHTVTAVLAQQAELAVPTSVLRAALQAVQRAKDLPTQHLQLVKLVQAAMLMAEVLRQGAQAVPA
jgi:hypothetical protein